MFYCSQLRGLAKIEAMMDNGIVLKRTENLSLDLVATSFVVPNIGIFFNNTC